MDRNNSNQIYTTRTYVSKVYSVKFVCDCHCVCWLTLADLVKNAPCPCNKGLSQNRRSSPVGLSGSFPPSFSKPFFLPQQKFIMTRSLFCLWFSLEAKGLDHEMLFYSGSITRVELFLTYT